MLNNKILTNITLPQNFLMKITMSVMMIMTNKTFPNMPNKLIFFDNVDDDDDVHDVDGNDDDDE